MNVTTSPQQKIDPPAISFQHNPIPRQSIITSEVDAYADTPSSNILSISTDKGKEDLLSPSSLPSSTSTDPPADIIVTTTEKTASITSLSFPLGQQIGSSINPPSITTSTKHNAISSKISSKKARRLWPLHVEAIIHPCCPTSFDILRPEIEKYIICIGQVSFMYTEGPLDLSCATPLIQKSCIEVSIVGIDQSNHIITDSSSNHPTTTTKTTTLTPTIASWNISTVRVHTYSLSTEEAEPEEIGNDDGNSDETIVTDACDTLPLPHATLHTSWDNLILPHPIKANLLGYAESALLFSNARVSPHVISWNRIMLLHGPPGTGKTSLCRALAHKLSIRTQHVFPAGGYLLEIKSHSLFSKWFSESGKLVSKLFDRIREMVEDEPHGLFCVLIDEVESLAASRVRGGGGDVNDAVRAVNSLLTSMDRLKAYRNVMILTTTNITESVDGAFVDRVDMKQFIGLPCLEARFEILRSCLEELIRVGIVLRNTSMDCNKDDVGQGEDAGGINIESNRNSLRRFQQIAPFREGRLGGDSVDFLEGLLYDCAEMADGLSGRTLRKLPFQSHAFFVLSSEPVSLEGFLGALKDGIEKEQRARKDLN